MYYYHYLTFEDIHSKVRRRIVSWRNLSYEKHKYANYLRIVSGTSITEFDLQYFHGKLAGPASPNGT